MCVLSLQLDLITDLLGTPSLEAMRTACEGAKAHILRGPHKQVQLETAGLSQLGHGSSSVLSSGRDPAAASSQRFTPQSDPRGVFVQTHFVWMFNPRTVSVCKSGEGYQGWLWWCSAVGWGLFELLLLHGGFLLVKCVSGFWLVCMV